MLPFITGQQLGRFDIATAFILLLLSQVSTTWSQTTGLGLVASSPFQMTLRPTPSQLGFAALQVVQDAIRLALLNQNSSQYLNAQVVIEQVQFLTFNGTALPPASSVQFYVLGTTAITDTSVNPEIGLDALIQSTFANTVGQNQFLTFLHSESNTVLSNVTQVSVLALTNPPPSAVVSSASTRKLSTLDIVLVVISALIFLGIAWMVIQHHCDRGYIENLRLRTINTPPPAPPLMTDHSSGLASVKVPTTITPERDNTETDLELSTPSTPSTSQALAGVDRTPSPQTPRRVVRITTVTNSSVTPKRLLTTPSIDGSSVQTLHEYNVGAFPRVTETTIGKDFTLPLSVFSGSANQSSVPCQSISLRGQNNIINFKSNTTFDSIPSRSTTDQVAICDCHEDLFHVDVDGICPSPSHHKEDDNKSKSSHSSAISEWIKSIRVVPKGAAAAAEKKGPIHPAMTLPGHFSSPDSASMDHSTLIMSSLEQTSLEGSMASSSVASSTDESETAVRQRDEV